MVLKARDEFLNGQYAVKNTEGELIPARETIVLTDLKKQTQIETVTDNRHLSADSLLYTMNGDERYNVTKFLANHITLLNASTESFIDGTPSVDDVTEETVVSVFNDWTKRLMADYPFLTTFLVMKAQPLLPGLQTPQLTDAILHNKFPYGDIIARRQKEDPDNPDLQDLFTEFNTEKDKLTKAYGDLTEQQGMGPTVRKSALKKPDEL